MTQEMIQSQAIVLQLPFRFAMGAFGCKMGAAGCKTGSVGATPSFRFLFAVSPMFALCRSLGLSGAVSTASLKTERAANRGLCGQA